jgi:hypothetical protein
MGATLRTIQMVEETLQTLDYPTKVADLKRALPRQVQHDTLKEILTYLANKHHILMVPDGIIPTYNPDPAFQKMVAEAKDFREVMDEILKERQTKKSYDRSQRKSRKTASRRA